MRISLKTACVMDKGLVSMLMGKAPLALGRKGYWHGFGVEVTAEGVKWTGSWVQENKA
jgi:hypothetical protein